MAPTTAPVPGFAAIAADGLTIRGLAALAGCEIRSVAVELEQQRIELVRAHRVAIHEKLATVPIALPDGEVHVEIEHPVARGVLGISRSGGLEIELLVLGRPFRVIREPGELPLHAVVDVAVDRIDPSFTEVPDDVRTTIIHAMKKRTPQLFVAIAKATPTALGDPGTVRSLLERWIEDGSLARETREALIQAEAFRTVQGGRVSLERAAGARRTVSMATWTGDWLGVGGDVATGLDEPIVQIDDPRLAKVVQHLHHGVCVDVTTAVAKLQASRRMERGLLPVPTLDGIAPDLKRKLGELGELGRALGHGEIGLVEGAVSVAVLCEHGEAKGEISIDVLPPVKIALEAPDLVTALPHAQSGIAQLRALGLIDEEPHPIGVKVQALAGHLVRAVLAATARDRLPLGIRAGLRRAVFAQRIDPADLDGVALFETVEGNWIDVTRLDAQRAVFSTVWATAESGPLGRPLDERRLVLRLSHADIAFARERGYAIIDAASELELDAIARRNRDRLPARSLALPTDGVLARVDLDGDGVTSPRGVVGILAPGNAALRGIRPHFGMRPLETTADPCPWPTVASVDDARLEPDRTWAHPKETPAWQDVLGEVRAASLQLVSRVVAAPPTALVSLAVDAELLEALPPSELRVAGALWLVDRGPPEIEIVGGRGPIRPAHGIAICGMLYIHGAISQPHIDAAVNALVGRAQPRLLRLLAARDDLDNAIVAPHVAHGLALGRIVPADVPTTVFTCFAPAPLDAGSLAELLGGRGTVPIIDSPDPLLEHLAVVDDGTDLANVVLTALGRRAQRDHAVPRARPARPAPVVRAPVVPAAPVKSHHLVGLVARVQSRLVAIGLTNVEIVIDDRATPMIEFRGILRIAGDNARLRALADALLANRPWATTAIDALVAHVVTVLNVALTDVTDITEAHALGALLANPA